MGADLLSQYEIPNLHPLAVHFPLVLLLLAAGVAVLYAAFGRPVWRLAALALFALGTVGTFAAQQTGETMEHEMEGEPIVDAVLGTHERMADYTLWAAIVATVVFGGLSAASRRGRRAGGTRANGLPAPEPLVWRVGALVPALAAAALVAWTSHLGGVMVWGVPAS
ncbi:MAG TPA: DUF2231 domain-containing protein [Rubricoccaceae bacterium]|jgi:hypothetical protein